MSEAKSRNAPLRLRKRRSDATYASNAERQRAYRRRKAEQNSGRLLEVYRAAGNKVPVGAKLSARHYGIIGNLKKKLIAEVRREEEENMPRPASTRGFDGSGTTDLT